MDFLLGWLTGLISGIAFGYILCQLSERYLRHKQQEIWLESMKPFITSLMTYLVGNIGGIRGPTGPSSPCNSKTHCQTESSSPTGPKAEGNSNQQSSSPTGPPIFSDNVKPESDNIPIL